MSDDEDNSTMNPLEVYLSQKLSKQKDPRDTARYLFKNYLYHGPKSKDLMLLYQMGVFGVWGVLMLHTYCILYEFDRHYLTYLICLFSFLTVYNFFAVSFKDPGVIHSPNKKAQLSECEI